jgi:transposase
MARDQKKAQDEGRTIVYVDAAAFYLLPAVVRTYAPIGETPILRAPKSYAHLSVISGVTETGKLYVRQQACAYRGPAIVGFLEHLQRHIDGRLLVLWDGARIHRSEPVKDFLAREDCRIRLERLPAYAPELNPDEGIWSYLKYVELRNLVCHTLDELRDELRLAIARLRHKAHVLRGVITQTGL